MVSGERKLKVPGLGARLREARSVCRLTQAAVAGRIGVSDVTVRQWEADRQTPTVEKLERLAVLYEVSVDWLLGVDPTSQVDIGDPALRQFFRGGEFEAMDDDERDLIRRAIETARKLHDSRQPDA